MRGWTGLRLKLLFFKMDPLESEVKAQVLASGHHIIVESLVKNLVFPLEPQSRLQTLGRGRAELCPGNRHRRWEHVDLWLSACAFLRVTPSLRAVAASPCLSTAWDGTKARRIWEGGPQPTAELQKPGWASGLTESAIGDQEVTRDSGNGQAGITWYSPVASGGPDTSLSVLGIWLRTQTDLSQESE